MATSTVDAQDTTTTTFSIENGDVQGLIQAVTMANDEVLYPGQNIIMLAPDGMYILIESLDAGTGEVGLPVITSSVSILGNGATIARSSDEGIPEFRILSIDVSGNLELQNVIITGGCARAEQANVITVAGDGGGIFNHGGHVTISDSTVENNTAQNYGGGIANSGEMTIINSTITHNTSEQFGGGIDNFGGIQPGVLTIRDTNVTGNHAEIGGGLSNRGELSIIGSTITNNSSAHGGGVMLFSGSASIGSTTFSSNTAEVEGGGLTAAPETTSLLTDCEFTGNSAGEEGGAIAGAGTLSVIATMFSTNTSSRGGAIGNEGEMQISSSTFDDNASTLVGGAIRNYASGSLDIQDSTFSGNTATELGGAIENEGRFRMSGTTLSDNSSGNFGGGLLNTGEANISTSAFQGNRTSLSGGGVYNHSTGNLTISTCTLSSNTAQYGGALINYGGTARLERSLLERNEAVEYGGAINNSEGGSLVVSTSILYANEANYGGGVTNSANIVISNTSIVNNTAEDYGGGILNAEGGHVSLSFSTLWQNQAAHFGAGIDNSGVATVKNSIIGNSLAGNDCDNTPFLGEFTSEGGNFDTDGTCPEFVHASRETIGLHELAQNSESAGILEPTHESIALSAASDCSTTEGIRVRLDQRGIQRPQGEGCDSGAFEMPETNN